MIFHHVPCEKKKKEKEENRDQKEKKETNLYVRLYNVFYFLQSKNTMNETKEHNRNKKKKNHIYTYMAPPPPPPPPCIIGLTGPGMSFTLEKTPSFFNE